jgi:hypothetical protein
VTTFHPRLDGAGRKVLITKPSKPSPASAWGDPSATVVVVPGGHVPAELHGVSFAPWEPPDRTWWEAAAAEVAVVEPPFVCPVGLKPAAGALVVEPDGRAWCVAPTGRFGGHEFTLPKGRTDGRSPSATGLVEVYEESGLCVRLNTFLCDVPRSETFTRFFIATRITGSPAEMTWESQAVMLAPLLVLRTILSHPGDQSVLGSFAQSNWKLSNLAWQVDQRAHHT